MIKLTLPTCHIQSMRYSFRHWSCTIGTAKSYNGSDADRHWIMEYARMGSWKPMYQDCPCSPHGWRVHERDKTNILETLEEIWSFDYTHEDHNDLRIFRKSVISTYPSSWRWNSRNGWIDIQKLDTPCATIDDDTDMRRTPNSTPCRRIWIPHASACRVADAFAFHFMRAKNIQRRKLLCQRRLKYIARSAAIPARDLERANP